jgi:galactose mutarotase-like enzyme
MGFPGDVYVSVTYTVTDKNEWQISYSAVSNTLVTPVSLTQHCRVWPEGHAPPLGK